MHGTRLPDRLAKSIPVSAPQMANLCGYGMQSVTNGDQSGLSGTSSLAHSVGKSWRSCRILTLTPLFGSLCLTHWSKQDLQKRLKVQRNICFANGSLMKLLRTISLALRRLVLSLFQKSSMTTHGMRRPVTYANGHAVLLRLRTSVKRSGSSRKNGSTKTFQRSVIRRPRTISIQSRKESTR